MSEDDVHLNRMYNSQIIILNRVRTERVGVRIPLSNSYMGRDGVVGIATRYGFDGMGIEPGGGSNFPHLPRPALEPTQPPITDAFPGVKQPVRGVNHPSQTSADVKERVQLYLYSLSVPSWQVTG